MLINELPISPEKSISDTYHSVQPETAKMILQKNEVGGFTVQKLNPTKDTSKMSAWYLRRSK